MGTADLSCVSLQALLGAPGLHLLAAVTQPDRPKGRDLKLQPTPVKELALRHHIPVLQPEKARSADFVEELRALAPDLIAVAAYGQILPRSILDLPRFGCLNVHTSLLPRYRGAGPIQWAILNGDVATGVTIMKMDVTLDTGDILAQDVTPIRAEDNAVTLHDRLALMAQRDQGGPEGQAGNEGAGAVDGVEHPDELGVRAVLAILFADDAVVGIGRRDGRSDRPFGALVCGGHGIKDPSGHRALVLQTVIGPEQGEDRRARRMGELDGEGLEPVKVRIGQGGGRRGHDDRITNTAPEGKTSVGPNHEITALRPVCRC